MQGISTQTIYRESYISPVIDKYQVSKVKPVHFVTGEYFDIRHFPTQVDHRLRELSEKCKQDPLWERLSPINRQIQIDQMMNSRLPSIETRRRHPCFVHKPNRPLKNLNVKYPKLYDYYKKFPGRSMRYKKEAALCRRTTAQIDFSHLPEYPNGLYSDDDEPEQMSEFKLVNHCLDNIEPQKERNYPKIPYLAYQSGILPLACQKVNRLERQTSHWPEFSFLYNSCSSR